MNIKMVILKKKLSFWLISMLVEQLTITQTKKSWLAQVKMALLDYGMLLQTQPIHQ
jgi:hypothetical protein